MDDNGVVHAAAMTLELHIPESRSLKAKRAAVRPILDGLRHRFRISVAEVDRHEQWQRATVAVAVVAESERRVRDLLDAAERFVAGAPAVELLGCCVGWLELDEELRYRGARDETPGWATSGGKGEG